VGARIAFRDAVLEDVSTFSSGDWDRVAVLIAAERFIARWERGLPWPPSPDELAREAPAKQVFDRDLVLALAQRIRALGLPLALASR
jgi:hypothetical protein